jgi:hypothetical protein
MHTVNNFIHKLKGAAHYTSALLLGSVLGITRDPSELIAPDILKVASIDAMVMKTAESARCIPGHNLSISVRKHQIIPLKYSILPTPPTKHG